MTITNVCLKTVKFIFSSNENYKLDPLGFVGVCLYEKIQQMNVIDTRMTNAIEI